jgi:digeranylgeranylglycerophospholipid reductase
MDFDVIVVGAGPAGCTAAAELAAEGFRVGLFEARRGREHAGKPIVVEVEDSVFSRVGLARPCGEEIPYDPALVRVFGPDRTEAFSFTTSVTVPVFLDALCRSLLERASSRGVELFDGYKATGVLAHGTRVSGARFLAKGRTEEVQARLVVDATGFDAALVRSLGPEAGIGFTESDNDVVVAQNHYHEIHWRKAEEAVRAGIHGDGELWVALGTLGAYSTEFSYLSLGRRRAYILMGCKAEQGAARLDRAVAEFKKRQGYYGRQISGGRGRIRIRHPLHRLVADGFMVIGEAASMVTPMNGSGVSTALLAGKMAAAVAAQALRTQAAPSTEHLWPFCARFHRGRGATLAVLAALRLMCERLTSDGISAMLTSGLLTAHDVLTTGNLDRPLICSTSLPAKVRALWKTPALRRQVLRTAALATALSLYYRNYPVQYDPARFEAWSGRVAGIFSLLGDGPTARSEERSEPIGPSGAA